MLPIKLTDGKLSYSLAHPSSSSSLEMSASLTAKAARALPSGGLGFLFFLDGAFVDGSIAVATSFSLLVLRFIFLVAFTSALETGFLGCFLDAFSLIGAPSEATLLEAGFDLAPFTTRLDEVSDISSIFWLGSCDCLLGGIVSSAERNHRRQEERGMIET